MLRPRWSLRLYVLHGHVIAMVVLTILLSRHVGLLLSYFAAWSCLKTSFQ